MFHPLGEISIRQFDSRSSTIIIRACNNPSGSCETYSKTGLIEVIFSDAISCCMIVFALDYTIAE